MQTSSDATPTTSDGSSSPAVGSSSRRSRDTDLVVMCGAKRSAESGHEGTLYKSRALTKEGVQRPHRGRNDNSATSAHVSSSSVQSTETTSHRFPRAAHGRKYHVVNIGSAENQALYDTYHLSMPRLDIYDHTPYALYNSKSDYFFEEDKWDRADQKN